MNIRRIAGSCFLAALFLSITAVSSPGLGQMGETANAEFVITASVKGSKTPPPLQQKDVNVTLKNRPAEITSWVPLRGQDANLQLVFLFDEAAPHNLALQVPSLRTFIDALPPGAEVGVAYMQNGRAVFTQSLTSDHALASKGLRVTNSIPGISGSPYFCLSDLAKRWPSSTKRRVVLMVTSGEDPYYPQRDMQDPYLASAIRDSQKAGLLVYSIYFRTVGSQRTGSFATLIGQSYLQQLAKSTGAQSFAGNMINPVSFDPYLEQFKTFLDNQYMVSITAQGSGLQSIRVKSNVRGIDVSAPAAVNVGSKQ